MAAMNLIVLEDGGAELLYPVTIGRPSYAIRCAAFRLIDWIAQQACHRVGLIRNYLEPIQRHDFPWLETALNPQHPWTMVVNARMAPTVSNFKQLDQIKSRVATESRSLVARSGCAVAAAIVPTAEIDNSGDPASIIRSIEDYCNSDTEAIQRNGYSFALLEYPHDIIRENKDNLSDGLHWRIANANYREMQPGVFVADDVRMGQHVVMDTSSGPILIESGASVGHFTLLEGPVYIGKNCRIIEHAAIKDCVTLGPTTKIGGEVEASVVDAYTNKQHHGFLGHSYLGSWINLGAGTCNSDLKNTYGTVNMEYRGKRVPTGMQFVGCVIGDYAKTAINTSIFTGKTIGACSMVYGFVTTNVPSFVNYARSFGQTTELPPTVMQSTQQRMFARRQVEQRPCDRQLITDMYHATASERQLSEEPLIL